MLALLLKYSPHPLWLLWSVQKEVVPSAGVRLATISELPARGVKAMSVHNCISARIISKATIYWGEGNPSLELAACPHLHSLSNPSATSPAVSTASVSSCPSSGKALPRGRARLTFLPPPMSEAAQEAASHPRAWHMTLRFLSHWECRHSTRPHIHASQQSAPWYTE